MGASLPYEPAVGVELDSVNRVAAGRLKPLSSTCVSCPVYMKHLGCRCQGEPVPSPRMPAFCFASTPVPGEFFGYLIEDALRTRTHSLCAFEISAQIDPCLLNPLPISAAAVPPDSDRLASGDPN